MACIFLQTLTVWLDICFLLKIIPKEQNVEFIPVEI